MVDFRFRAELSKSHFKRAGRMKHAAAAARALERKSIENTLAAKPSSLGKLLRSHGAGCFPCEARLCDALIGATDVSSAAQPMKLAYDAKVRAQAIESMLFVRLPLESPLETDDFAFSHLARTTAGHPFARFLHLACAVAAEAIETQWGSVRQAYTSAITTHQNRHVSRATPPGLIVFVTTGGLQPRSGGMHETLETMQSLLGAQLQLVCSHGANWVGVDVLECEDKTLT